MIGRAHYRRWLASFRKRCGDARTRLPASQSDMHPLQKNRPQPASVNIAGLDFQTLSDVSWEDSDSLWSQRLGHRHSALNTGPGEASSLTTDPYLLTTAVMGGRPQAASLVRGLRPRNAPSPTTPAAPSVWQYDLDDPLRPGFAPNRASWHIPSMCQRRQDRRGDSHICPAPTPMTIASPLQKYSRSVPLGQTAHSRHTEHCLVVASGQSIANSVLTSGPSNN